ncbi:MAG: modification methylase [Rhodospirillaceae bacterium]|nr:modification methylase [Rhodospirillaceae bacterium]|tara:strand:- start:115 stop:1047 length:933 start_codon:yes stop_codon:yes gene_type:complete
MSKPILKWAGGKTQLINQIEKFLPEEIKNRKLKKYAEPFIGGGALFFYLQDKYKIDETYISDTNKDLILLYKTVKENLNELLKQLLIISNKYHAITIEENRKEYFYKIRELYNEGITESSYQNLTKESIFRAAQLIFLNRTSFNGLYRVNSMGLFNVPFGKYKNPGIYNEKGLKEASKLLKNTIIECSSYQNLPKEFLSNSLIYFDPPYRPLSNTSSFTAYNKSNFNDISQIELANYYKKISKNKNLYLILSNSDPKNSDKNDKFFDELYNQFIISRVSATRIINSKSEGRGKITEILVTNKEFKKVLKR